MKKISIDKLGYAVIIITIIMLNICIGSNIKEPVWIIQAIVSVFTAIYLIINKIKKKTNLIIKSKIDIAVLIFMIATIIPLIFKTYVTLDGVCNFILKYWSVYGLYILVRNIITEPKQIKIIINTIIISSIIPIIFGIDKLTLNIFQPILDLIEAVKIEDYRMISTFGYANTFAAYLGLTTSLAISEFLNVKGKRKIPYAVYIILASITIMLTQSKFVLALLTCLIILFIGKGIKDKKISQRSIKIGIVIIAICFIYFYLAIHIDKPFETTKEDSECVIRGIEPNTEYEFEFDVNVESDKNYDTIEINVVEINRYFSEKTLSRFTLSQEDKYKKVNITTNDKTQHIEIRIKNRLNQKFEIKKLKIDGNKYILDYKIIPEELVRIFTTFNFKNSSVWQRVDYWLDGIDIIKENWLIGTGGNTWRMMYGQVQDYLYYAKEAHSYILEVWMSFGIIGVISYIFIIAITIKNSQKELKNLKNEKVEYRRILSLIVGISIIVIHSLMDFDMSYLIMEMIFFMIIAILNKNNDKISKNIKIRDTVVIIVFVIIAIANTLGLVAKLLEDKEVVLSSKLAPWISKYQYNKIVYIENNKIENLNKIQHLKHYIENEPYKNQNTIYKIMCAEIIKNINENDMKYIINIWKNVDFERKYEIEQIRDKAETMLEFAQNLIDKEEYEYARTILELIKQDYDQNNNIILDYERNRISETITKFEHSYYTDTYNEAQKLLEEI